MHRNDAIRLGLTKYQGDKPCKYGHPPERYASTGNCTACMNAARSRIRQSIVGAEMGWPSITASVPKDCIPVLRAIVHDMRATGNEYDRRRRLYAELVHDLHVDQAERIVDAVTVTPGREFAPVRAPTAEELNALIPARFRK